VKESKRSIKSGNRYTTGEEAVLEGNSTKGDQGSQKGPTYLVAIDFSPCSVLALRRAKTLLGGKPGRIALIHVIDQDFLKTCSRSQLGSEKALMQRLSVQARSKVACLLRQEGLGEEDVDVIICKGVPFIEINRWAVQTKAEIVLMGSRGASGNMKTIFFGSTAERVLRFMKRPVLCVPPGENHKS
jgi:nucleotide-binding universal stress UspA family protein